MSLAKKSQCLVHFAFLKAMFGGAICSKELTKAGCLTRFLTCWFSTINLPPRCPDSQLLLNSCSKTVRIGYLRKRTKKANNSRIVSSKMLRAEERKEGILNKYLTSSLHILSPFTFLWALHYAASPSALLKSR